MLFMLALCAPAHAGACGFEQWSQVNSTGLGSHLRAGGPDLVSPVRRYSGKCAMVADAPANFVTDLSPLAEPKLFARFYAFIDLAGSPVTLLLGRNAANATVLTVRYNGTGFDFATRGTFANSAPIERGRWYAVEVAWAAGAAMTARVQGAGLPALPTVVTSPGLASDRIDSVALGWIDGPATGLVGLDAFEARRNTPATRLCRGNADASLRRDGNDEAMVRQEFLRSIPAAGEPDCNEDGRVDAGDLVCLRNIQQAGQADCEAFPGL